jgi:allantoin racemase
VALRLFVINPNSTPAMTQGIRRSAQRPAAPGTAPEVANPDGAPASIEARHDEAAAAPAFR